jgi:hypothetical protein
MATFIWEIQIQIFVCSPDAQFDEKSTPIGDKWHLKTFYSCIEKQGLRNIFNLCMDWFLGKSSSAVLTTMMLG